MMFLSKQAWKIMSLLQDKLENEGKDALHVDEIKRETNYDINVVERALTELSEVEFIWRNPEDSAALTPAGLNYDPLLDNGIGGDSEEWDGISNAMRNILDYITRTGLPTVPKFVIINALGLSPDEFDEALNGFDELGYPIRARID